MHGDGDFYTVFELSTKEAAKLKEKVVEKTEWKSFPLSTDVKQLANTNLNKSNFTVINNGYYLFKDKNDEDSPLLDRYSYNVVFAILDLDTNRLYVYEYDS